MEYDDSSPRAWQLHSFYYTPVVGMAALRGGGKKRLA